jgi:hypothetical protein
MYMWGASAGSGWPLGHAVLKLYGISIVVYILIGYGVRLARCQLMASLNTG